MKTNPFHQTVIVTGGATGIGYAVAEQFVGRGLTSCSTAVPARNWPAPLKNWETPIASLSSPPTSPSLPMRRLSSTPRSSASAAWMCW